MKIAFTITDASDAVHVGGEVIRETYIMELDVTKVPAAVLHHLHDIELSVMEKKPLYQSMSVSVVKG